MSAPRVSTWERSTKEFDELIQRAARGELMPDGFKRCEQLIAEAPERGLPRKKQHAPA